MVRDIRNAFREEQTDGMIAESLFFSYTSRPRHVSYKNFARNADNDLKQFYNLGTVGFTDLSGVSETFATAMRSWLEGVSDERLVSMLSLTPSGLSSSASNPSWDFTPFQRLFLLYYCYHPFAVTTKISVCKEDIMQEIGPASRPPKFGFSYEASKMKGSIPEYFIVDLPTALGKTSISAGICAMMLEKERFERLRREEKARSFGCIIQGPPERKFARLAMVVAGGNTFYHFCDEYKRLIDRWNVEKGDNVALWTGMRAPYSVDFAYQHCPHAVVWILPTNKFNDVLKAHPDISVALAVLDEMSYDVPRERSQTFKSRVLKTVILQATPQLLVQSSRGRSTLNDMFEGSSIHAPCLLREFIHTHEWTKCQKTVEHACRLSLCTTSSFFRSAIREDLHRMMPVGIDVMFVKSRKVTMASHILQNGLDVVPANFKNVLLSMFKSCMLDDASIKAICDACASDGALSIPSLIQTLDSINPQGSYMTNPLYRTRLDDIRERLKNRLLEFDEECPVCCTNPSSNSESGGIRMFGCCGYCVCGSCCERMSRCPFCRAFAPSNITRSDVPETSDASESRQTETSSNDDSSDTPSIPERPELTESLRAFSLPSTQRLKSLLESWTSERNMQVYNLTMALHALFYADYRKTLVVIFKTSHAMDEDQVHVSMPFDKDSMSLATGFDIVNVAGFMGGQGTRFQKVMKRFDDPAERMALVSVGENEKFLTGTNLVNADSLIFVGPVPTKIHTQAIGRICRCSTTRDNSKAIPVIKIVQGGSVEETHVTGRRRSFSEMQMS